MKKVRQILRQRRERRLDKQIRKELNKPVKKQIIELLDRNGSLHYGDIVMAIKRSPSKIHKHLLDLRQAGIVKIKEGSSEYLLSKSHNEMMNGL